MTGPATAEQIDYWCHCSYPGCDSVTLTAGTCSDCGKPVSIYEVPVSEPIIPTTLDGVLQELKAAYPAHKTTPGIQIASIEDLSDGTPQFYAGIHIFPAGVQSRKVVAKATASTSVQAMADAMQTWRNIIAAERSSG